MLFESKFIKTNVTALKIYKNVTFVGIGATIHVFCNGSKKLIHKVNIDWTRGEQVFGIEPFSQNKVLIFGGQFLILYETNDKCNLFNEIRRNTHTDWILEAKLINDESKIATVSMKNKVQIWDSTLKLIEVFQCEAQCILYSAHICYRNYEELIVLSGTVFNEVLVWKLNTKFVNCCPVRKRLKKHEGVIFSLCYNEKNGLICSTSDDRSAILWKVNKNNLLLELDQENPNIYSVCQVYGHLSRVFRCLILSDCFVTAGEDSLLNIWSLDGKLTQSIEANQGSPIWAVSYDKSENVLICGGGNGGVNTFSLDNKYTENKVCLPSKENPKLVGILASNNFVIFSELGDLYLYNNEAWLKVTAFEDLKSYVLMKISKCRNMLALAGFDGQVYIYKESKGTIHRICDYRSKNCSRIISVHWLTCNMILICQNEGKLTLLELKPPDLVIICCFSLPVGSQRCSTAATIFDNYLIVGDRKGNILKYEIGKKHPTQIIPKVHSHLGVTNLIVHKNQLISLGRNGVIKTFLFKESCLTLITSDKVPYSWLLDVIGDLVIAFSGNNFVIWNYKSKRLLLEKNCGGGHRSWDFIKCNQITFLYVKDKSVNALKFDFDDNKSYNLVEPFHLNEINTICVIKMNTQYLLISGGEDTTLRITVTNENLNSFDNVITLKAHLSSIRCVTIFKLPVEYSEKYLIFSAGGRAQVICWTLEYSDDSKDLLCHENHSFYEIIDSRDSETRIMDLCAVELLGKIILFAACSDGYVKVFYVDKCETFRLNLCRSIFYKLKCIFKIFVVEVLTRNVLVTLDSDGMIVFWNIDDLFTDTELRPFNSINVHQSGINTVSIKQLTPDSFVFLTGGDDNVVVLSYLKFEIDNSSINVQIIDQFKNAGVHWAQITGSFISEEYFLTASVDQRLILYKWSVKDESVKCEVLKKYNSSVADLKGLVCFKRKDFDVFIYGLGVELLKLSNK